MGFCSALFGSMDVLLETCLSSLRLREICPLSLFGLFGLLLSGIHLLKGSLPGCSVAFSSSYSGSTATAAAPAAGGGGPFHGPFPGLLVGVLGSSLSSSSTTFDSLMSEEVVPMAYGLELGVLCDYLKS